jgi:hypothetical protein
MLRPVRLKLQAKSHDRAPRPTAWCLRGKHTCGIGIGLSGLGGKAGHGQACAWAQRVWQHDAGCWVDEKITGGLWDSC